MIREGLSNDITSKDFDVGYLLGSNVVRIRNGEDISEVCLLMAKPQNNIMLWCDGLRDNKKHLLSESDDETDQPKKKQKKSESERDEEVQDYVDELSK